MLTLENEQNLDEAIGKLKAIPDEKKKRSEGIR